MRGWRRLTVNSPWRIQSADSILADWNSDNGLNGELVTSASQLVGATLDSIEVIPPAWDLLLKWSNGWSVFVFSDSDDLRDDAWYILGIDGLEIAAGPRKGKASRENWYARKTQSM
jgi:hypothetical protein